MRFRIDVAVDPSVTPAVARLTLSCAPAAWAPLQRIVTLTSDDKGGAMPLPPEPPPPGDPALEALCKGDPAQFHRALRHFRARRVDDSRAFGRYLFAVLLGPDWWQSIRTAPRAAGDTLVELALAWPPDEASFPFDRLPWELLHDGISPLVASHDPRVAITRIVPRPRPAGEPVGPSPAPLDLPPRVLFVIGAAPDDPRVRAAAEVLGLLRILENPERTVHARILERASPKRVTDAVKSFRPEVVHFICHGDVKDGKSWLELQPDEPGDQTACDSEKLLDMLRPGGQAPPTIVVLSACRTAEASDGAEGAPVPTTPQLAAMPNQPLALASLGARLVFGGVPIVIGMSGRVSDVAARLFTRRFEACLLEGQPLVSATADARRAPFVDGRVQQTSIDWAYPTVLLDESVAPDYAPTPALGKAGGAGSKQDEWVTSFRVTGDKQPVFCARQDFFDAFDDLFRRKGRGMLAAYAPPEPDDEGRARYGKTRLLEQLTFRALRDGHLPVVLSSPQRTSTPLTLPKLIEALRKQQMFVTQHLGLEQPAHRLVAELKKVADNLATLPAALEAIGKARAGALADEQAAAADARQRYRQRVASIDNLKAELNDSGLTGRAVCFALQYDMWALAQQFRSVLRTMRDERVKAQRAIPPWLEEPDTARGVLLLDNLDLCEESFISALFELTNQGGLGSADDPTPIVVTFSLDDGPGSQVLRPIAEMPKPHVSVIRLQAFPKGEDVLVYQRVLLHPFNTTLYDYEGVSSARPFAVDGSTDAAVAKSCEDYFRLLVKGRPANLNKENLYAAAQNAKTKTYLVDADDTDVLKGLGLLL